jgi:hypothetical protein
VSTVQEIQEAITQLPELQRFELVQWLHSHYDTISIEDEADILAEAAEGEREIREGKGIPLEDLRKMTRTWITK